MDARSLLEQLLKAGSTVVSQQVGAAKAAAQHPDAGKYAKGAAVGGLLGALLGSQGGRRMGGKALKVGSVAALGMLAWKTYQEYQAQQQRAQPATPGGGQMPALAAPTDPQAQALLRAMIAAAKSDGHMDERERGLIEAELERAAAGPTLRQWVADELRRPLDPAEVAAGATGPEHAAELYLASVAVVDETTPMERAYLDALAAALRLEPPLRARLEAQLQG